MSLRGRLTTALLLVLLGPVLLGVVFVGLTVGAVANQRVAERLDRARAATVTSVGAMCRQLHAAAGAVAVVADPAARMAAAEELVDAGLTSAVRIVDAVGVTVLTTRHAPAPPWAPCAAEIEAPASYTALSARVELRDQRGISLGAIVVAQVVDRDFIVRLAAASGAAVTQIRADPAGRLTTGHSTESPRYRPGVLAAAQRGAGGGGAHEVDGPAGLRYVSHLGPADGQPLRLLLSVPQEETSLLYPALVTLVLVTGAGSLIVASWLARDTTGPLAALAAAADRFADGDLAARVPVRGHDEVGRLAATFNRMTRQTEAYVEALTASRDQLRGHLEILGDTLASTHDLDRILRVILEAAMAATSAQAGVVLLVGEDGMLVGRCAEGLAGRLPGRPADADVTELRIPVGAGVLGAVAATGASRRGADGDDPILLAPDEPRCRSYMAVPFSMRVADDPPESRLAVGGVLALYDRLGAAEFDDADMSTLRTFAGQAAVAVDNVHAHEEAQRLSLTDPLTGLWNYRYLQESARREIERAIRFDRTLTFLALDIDRFKKINDTYGHGAGDEVLTEFARRLRLGLREVDSVFRRGGEEFVVLLPETDTDGGEVVARRLGALVRQAPMTVHTADASAPVRIPVTTSIGVAVFPRHAGGAAEALGAADRALYDAKANGRDTYRIAVERPVVGASSGPRPPRQAGGR
ncbi:diguanylate cyclase [Pilimelia columellifera]|uniref:Diguanylate cyclase n=1 Tax=Pilimelia columellifera subsp. columellifera TaxID=706583 RepID=A0ABN3NG18_9ACTN